jgi:hypothetical protein
MTGRINEAVYQLLLLKSMSLDFDGACMESH